MNNNVFDARCFYICRYVGGWMGRMDIEWMGELYKVGIYSTRQLQGLYMRKGMWSRGE